MPSLPMEYHYAFVTSLLILELLFLRQASAVYAREEPYVTLARCRVQCVQQFVAPASIDDDNACWDTHNYRTDYSQRCSNCWDLCKIFATNRLTLAKACHNNKLCGEGCQGACRFIDSQPTESQLAGEWRFPQDVQSQTDVKELQLHWQTPHLLTTAGQEQALDDLAVGPVVYVLLTRNSNKLHDGWQVIQQLLSNRIRIELDALPLAPEFLLMAVSQSGQIAQMDFKPHSIVIGDIEDPSGPRLWQLKEEPEAGWYVNSVRDIQVNLTLTTRVKERPDKSRYKAQAAEVQFRGTDWLSTDTERVYQLRWIFLTCRTAYPYMPGCTDPRDDHATTLFARGNETVSYTMTGLKFNSLYLMVVLLAEDYRVKTEVVFKTSPCFHPDPLKFSQCLDEIPEEDLPVVPIKKAKDNDIHDAGEEYGSIGYTFVTKPAIVPRAVQMAVNISSMQLTSENEHTLVQVNFTWAPVANQTAVSYNVTAQMLHGQDKMLVSIQQTSRPFIILKLEQNQLYTVQVEASFKLPNSTARSNLFWDAIEFNTSDVHLAIYQGPLAFQLKDGGQARQVSGIIIGVSCVLVLVLALLVTLLYRKRKSFKDILVTKATVAKSNSYKSNVGGKSDYSNQLIVFSDDWELDPTRLKFSSLLGQGAFGKVVTGYYDNQKVAIKLVREGAPLSYKEDLVAEIHLMKRIGNHPNIVCLIGACTLAEPIALVMEYVPYGNLQNFLKKCRLEGDLHKRSDGPAEIVYTLVQDSGCPENGVVTPADMLSFARQVAMAMEYLTEKKYVHRDLAARNVLIGHNKVVKVCDFGLSRDIFNDNHYKKLTNGKLPLKWMAIESLRDRIFTTQSDVWSFGILLWEIVTMGASPYPNVALADLYYVLSNGYRMDRPSNCSDELYAVMRSCWEDEPLDRPTFTQLRMMLEDLLTEDRNYLVLENIDVPLTNSDNSSSPSPAPSSSDSPSTLGQSDGAIGGRGGEAAGKGRVHPVPPPSYPLSSSSLVYPAVAAAPTVAPTPLPQSLPIHKTKKASPRRDNLCIKVRIHQKSTDRLIRPSESDSSPSSC